MSQPKIAAARVGLSMVRQIVIEVEPPDDSQTVFRLCIDENLVAEGLTAAQAHMLVGEVLDRIGMSKPNEAAKKTPRDF
jgi:hypothetical protein